jgi:hypothetical protein
LIAVAVRRDGVGSFSSNHIAFVILEDALCPNANDVAAIMT